MKRTRRKLTPLRRIALLGAALIACAVAAAPAGADPITGGATRLKLDRKTLEAFGDLNIGIRPTGAARPLRNGVSFPISGGHVTAETQVDAALKHRGGLGFFTRRGTRIKVAKFRIEIGRKLRLFAKARGSEVRFLNLKPVDISGGSEFLELKSSRASLTRPGAKLLSKALPGRFAPGLRLGKVSINAEVN